MTRLIKGTHSYRFHCPGCKIDHMIAISGWTFNGDFERPTFSPSFRVVAPPPRCHLFIRDGQIQYCQDCDHELAGKTVDLPPVSAEIVQ